MTPEALDSLSRQELIALVLALMEQNEALAARVAVLEARLSAPPKTPGNSSLPPCWRAISERYAAAKAGQLTI